MKEFDDVHKLIEEQAESPFDREALHDIADLLSGGVLSQEPRESFRRDLRQRLEAEMRMARRQSSPWFRTPVALGAAAAVTLVVIAGSAVWGWQAWSGPKGPGAANLAALPAGSAPAPSAEHSVADSALQDKSASTGGSPQTAFALDAPGQVGAAEYRGDTGTANGAQVSRGTGARPALRDGVLVRVAPGTASFSLDTALPVVPSQQQGYELTPAAVTDVDVTATAQRLGLAGAVQGDSGTMWVGAAVPGQTPASELPAYKQPGRWLVANRSWGNSWAFYFTDDTVPVPQPGTTTTREAAEQDAGAFLAAAGIPSGQIALAARPEPDGTSYWFDWNLVLGDVDVRGVQGAVRVGAGGHVTYASWPAFLTVAPTASRMVKSPEEAFAELRNMAFDWQRAEPKLNVTHVTLVYRWPAGASVATPNELDLAYEFSVRDADGNQSNLYVSAWR